MSTIADLWSAAERAGAGRPALLGGEQVSFAELGGRIRTAADTLVHSLSVRPGDVVAILAPNSA
ncbi:MAG: hypothetical protein M3Y31_05240, partial [Gemmatimonadota bacterium]|nr:hypothetical protein [Gemmatimonadota bacterium]